MIARIFWLADKDRGRLGRAQLPDREREIGETHAVTPARDRLQAIPHAKMTRRCPSSEMNKMAEGQGSDSRTSPFRVAGVRVRYRKALSIALKQEAKLWELRASTSLAWLLRDQGRRPEAHDLLASIYGWFTEGFDFPDLKEAKALLEAIGA